MQKVISVNLNGNAYQLDENGYQALHAYLTRAEQQLEGNPDRSEIMADLEQAIADKCQKYLGPHKSVVSAQEVAQIVAEMGPVDSPAGQDSQDDAATSAKTANDKNTPPKRLYRIADGAMIAGVCNGLAAHFQVDVTIVRIAFVVAAVITQGVGILLYVVLMFVIPEAKTPEARAAAAGVPLNAREVIERAKKQYAQGRTEWRRRWRQQRRHWRRQGWSPVTPMAYAPPAWAAIVLPMFGLMHVGLFLLMAAMMVSLVNTGAVFDLELPPDLPIWAAALILFVAYQIAVSPLRAFQHWVSYPRPIQQPGWVGFTNAVVGLIGAALVVWLVSNNIPEIREFLQHLPELFREFAETLEEVRER